MDIYCYNEKCLHKFNYTGKKKSDFETVTCPKCRYKLKLGKSKNKILKPEIPLPHVPTSLPHQERNTPTSRLTSLPHPTSLPEIPSKPHFEQDYKNFLEFTCEGWSVYRDTSKLGRIIELPQKITEIIELPLR